MNARLARLNDLIQSMEDTEVKLYRFFDLSPDLLTIVCPSGQIVKANKAWYTMLGYDSVEGHSLIDYIENNDQYKMNFVLEQSRTNKVTGCRITLVCKDGEHHPVELSTSEADVDGLIYIVARSLTATPW